MNSKFDNHVLILTFISCIYFNPSGAQVKVDTIYPLQGVYDVHPNWSSNGKKLTFVSNRTDGSRIYLMNIDGSDLEQLNNGHILNYNPIWSPNQNSILYSTVLAAENHEIFIYPLYGTEPQRLTNHPLADKYARFSPDGETIIFASQRDNIEHTPEPKYDLYEMKIDGSELRRLTYQLQNDTHPAYSPDGTNIIWTRELLGTSSDNADNSEIFMMNSKLSNVTNLTNHKSFDGYPAWSPDGKRIVFASDRHAIREGNLQLFAMNADGSNVQQLTWNNHEEQDINPDWSPDGKRIIFNRVGKEETKIFSLNIETTSSIAFFNEVTTGPLTQGRTASRGIAWGYYDGDSFPDILVANTMNNSNFLFKNTGDRGFIQIVEGDPVTSAGWTEGVSWIDYDNDGDLDIFYTNQSNQPNQLFQNQGDGNFIEVQAGNLTTGPSNSPMACWCDYDLDGDMDVYVVERDGADDALFKNEGEGNFTIVSSYSFPYKGGDGRTCAWGDINGDGYPDLYVGNFLDKTGQEVRKSSNFLYTNNSDGSFTEVVNSVVTTDRNRNYGASFVDFDQDNDLDLFLTNIDRTDSNLLYKNDGSGKFSKTNTAITLAENRPSKGHTWGDFDNDGDLDLFVANGTEGTSPEKIMNYLFLNDGEGNFEIFHDLVMVNTPNISAGTAWADYDRDGDLDIFVSNWGNNTEKNQFYRNDLYGTKWIELALRGSTSNYFGIGAKVRLRITIEGIDKWLTRWLLPQTGYASQNEPIIHFGLGKAERVEEIEVYWPSGKINRLVNIDSNQLLFINESNP